MEPDLIDLDHWLLWALYAAAVALGAAAAWACVRGHDAGGEG